MTHDILCVAYRCHFFLLCLLPSSPLSHSPAKKETENRVLVAIGLLDHTVKVFYNDSLKFYLSL
jgi:hypothetical protein